MVALDMPMPLRASQQDVDNTSNLADQRVVMMSLTEVEILDWCEKLGHLL